MPKINDNKKPISELLIESEIKITDRYEQAPVIMQIIQDNESYNLFTLGNISSIIGKAKSRKSFATTMFCAAGIVSGYSNQIIFNTGILGKKDIILFDTEQSKYDVYLVANRICRLNEHLQQPINFKIYGLRQFSTQERIDIIEYALYLERNPGLVFIDGVRDLVTDINSADQATEITTKLMKWSGELQCHICTVIHQNKGDLSARGHIGTEIINKSETVISVTKDTNTDNESTIKPEFMRGKEFKEFNFAIHNYMPFYSGNKALIPIKKDNEFAPF